MSDASGNYSVSGLSGHPYVVCQVIQAGWTQTYPTPVFADGICPGGVSGYSMNLPAGTSSPFNDFANSR